MTEASNVIALSEARAKAWRTAIPNPPFVPYADLVSRLRERGAHLRTNAGADLREAACAIETLVAAVRSAAGTFSQVAAESAAPSDLGVLIMDLLWRICAAEASSPSTADDEQDGRCELEDLYRTFDRLCGQALRSSATALGDLVTLAIVATARGDLGEAHTKLVTEILQMGSGING